jgi:phage tail sheath protein FI
MPVAVSYPGVYIEELPSGVHTITGVATSIAAFIGWSNQGPTEPTLVLSWSDYVRTFGGLIAGVPLGYAVYHFFGNGGSQAYIIRLTSADAADAVAPPLTAGTGTITISAASPGAWANNYGITIKNQVDSTGKPTGRFSLQVVYNPNPGVTPATVVESFVNLSATSPDTQGRYVVDILNAQSNFVTATANAPTAPPADILITAPEMLNAKGGTAGADGTPLAPAVPPAAAGAFENALLDPKNGVGGVNQLVHVDLFNLLCVPGLADPATISTLETFCANHRAFMIVDCAQADTFASLQKSGGPSSSITGTAGTNAAFYFPWINAPDPLNQGGTGPFPPCGYVAGIYASTDGSRGVWKAPAGTAASLSGVIGPSVTLNDEENGFLNPLAVNCIRNFSVYGTVVWGARTLQGNDEIGSQWKYVPVRRLALFIEESLYRGTQWAVFEPNDEPLWASLRLNIGSFMQTLFRQGAFQGQTPTDAYFVKCDDETTTQNDINRGIVNVLVGFAPLLPAEFVVIQIEQLAGQTSS